MSVNIERTIKEVKKGYKEYVTDRYDSKTFKKVEEQFQSEYLKDDTLEYVLKELIGELYYLSLVQVCERDGIDNSILASNMGVLLCDLVDKHKGRD